MTGKKSLGPPSIENTKSAPISSTKIKLILKKIENYKYYKNLSKILNNFVMFNLKQTSCNQYFPFRYPVHEPYYNCRNEDDFLEIYFS
jgi:phenylalanyl-tRNA synthetase alpha subunit